MSWPKTHLKDCSCARHDRTRAGKGPLPRTLEQLLVKGSRHKVHNQPVKRRMVAAGLLEDLCAKCGLGPAWHGEDLTLQLDHIDGDSDNWERENLQILCPNCHFQTSTWGCKKRVS